MVSQSPPRPNPTALLPSLSSRIMALDAIRQIAAFIVLVQHFFTIFEIKAPLWIRVGPFDAKGAVTLFFVLSGYVLALSIRREPLSPRGYLNFGIRRFLRLYPMHIAATILALVVLTWVKSQGGFTRALAMPVDFLQLTGPEIRQWLLQFTLVAPGMDSKFANPPVWTLMTEAKVSIVFPIIAWAILRLSPHAASTLVVALVLGSEWLDQNVFGTLALLGQFALGALIIRIPTGAFPQFNWRQWSACLVLSLGLYSCVSLRYDLPNIWIAYYLSSFGAVGIIIATLRWEALNDRFTALQRFFRVDISYGLYILHFPIMLWLRKLSGESVSALPGILLFAVSLGLTIVLSIVLMFIVERPAIALGKRLTGHRPAAAP